MDILASNTFGQTTKLTREHVRATLSNTYEGMAHVYAHYPAMVVITRNKEAKDWVITVEELSDAGEENTPLPSVYKAQFTDEALDAAITLFLALTKSRRKDFEQELYKKLGRWIFPIPRAPEHARAQTYLYEAFHKGIERSLAGRRPRRARTGGSTGEGQRIG